MAEQKVSASAINYEAAMASETIKQQDLGSVKELVMRKLKSKLIITIE